MIASSPANAFNRIDPLSGAVLGLLGQGAFALRRLAFKPVRRLLSKQVPCGLAIASQIGQVRPQAERSITDLHRINANVPLDVLGTLTCLTETRTAGFQMLLLALTSALVVEAPMIPAFFTGESLHEFCTRADDSECLMYVAGALDGIFYVRFSDQPVRLCPSKMSNRDAAALVVDYIENNPEARKLAGAAVIRKALAPKLECSAPKLATTD